jgi:hypothetical protein
MKSKTLFKIGLACMGFIGIAMFALGISHVAGGARSTFHWTVVTTSGVANCVVSILGFWAMRGRHEGTTKN